MSCIKPYKIQEYIDGELSRDEAARIAKHITGCDKCAAEVEHRRLLATGIKKAINLLTDKHEIPAFVAPANAIKKRTVTLRRIVYSVSAACILLVILLIENKKEPAMKAQITIINSFKSDFDANRPISQQEMVIKVIDANGKVTEY